MAAATFLPDDTTVDEIGPETGKVLIVDDQDDDLELLRRLLTREGYTICTARSGDAAIASARSQSPDLVLLDVRVPGLDGFEVCRRLKEDPETRLTPLVLLTGIHDRRHRIEGLNAGADDLLTKPPNPHELKARVRSLIRLKRYTDELDSAESVILCLALTIEARDAYTRGHCRRLAAYSMALGADLGLGGNDLKALHRGAFLHDLGKICVPDSVLLKPSELTSQEYALMKQHPLVGETLCGELRSLRAVRPIVRHHHERLDGSGYPDGLKGDEIPLLAHVLSVVDVFDALTTNRPYRPALSVEQGCDELVEEANKGWRRRDLVEAFVAAAASGRLDQVLAGDPAAV